MAVLEVDAICPACGTVNTQRETLIEIVPSCIVVPVEVIWCKKCGTEIPVPGRAADTRGGSDE